MIYIILPVHNRREITEQFVKHLMVQTYGDFHLVLVDDGSSDGTGEMVLSYLPDTSVIRGRGDWWWAGGLQRGFEWMKSHGIPGTDIVLLINDDVSFGADFLQNAVNCLGQNPTALLLAQSWKEEEGLIADRGVSVNWKKFTFTPASEDSEVNCFSTRGLFMSADTFIKTGGFRPTLLPHYLSDYEFTIRAGRKGFIFKTDDRVRLTVNDQTTGYHSGIKAQSMSAFLRKLFSKRAAMNPVYFTNFVLITCPLPYIPLNILRIWKGFFISAIRHYRDGLR